MLDKLKEFANDFMLLLYNASVKIQSHKIAGLFLKSRFNNALSTIQL